MPQSTLIVHGLNPIIKRPRLFGLIKREMDPTLRCLQETYPNIKS